MEVLVVDDDPDLREALAQFLTLHGHEVSLAAHGAEALARVARQMPGLILLDMKMPVMNGWEFARDFRARYGRAAPIVVLTAAQDAALRAQEIDAEGFIPKPFELDELYAVVDRWVPRGESGNVK